MLDFADADAVIALAFIVVLYSDFTTSLPRTVHVQCAQKFL